MRLLFDQNLSYRLCKALAGDFPDASQVHLLGLEHADDRVIWDFARTNGFMLVSQDSDFADLAALWGPPPQVIWLRCGNQPTAAIAALLRRHFTTISAFEHDRGAACLELY
jgi:predicted nuclease of predicted toxin-antitoxin system